MQSLCFVSQTWLILTKQSDDGEKSDIVGGQHAGPVRKYQFNFNHKIRICALNSQLKSGEANGVHRCWELQRLLINSL